jgi:iron complex outermembrane receptor protein
MASRTTPQRLLLASCALASSLTTLAVPAVAQTTPQASAQSGIEDILVSARRRQESIQDVPVAVTAISPRELANMAAPDIRDLVGRTPNLVIDPVNAGPSAAAISIRGISFEDIEKSFDPAVGVLIDDIYIGTNTGQLLDFFDFETVEVLRGPQGTLFGRNTTAGVIRLQRTRPTGELGLRASATIGDYGRRDGRIVVNLPKFGDLISIKGFWLHAQTDDFYDNQTLGKDYGGRKYDNYGLTALIEKGDFDISFTWDHVKERTEIDQSATSQTGLDLICLQIPIGPGLLIRPTGIPGEQCDRNTSGDLYTTFSNVPGFAHNDGNNYTVNANLKLGELMLTSVSGWRQSNETVRQDFDSTSINFFDTQRVQTYRQFTQEFRVSGDLTDQIDFVTGFYYFNSNYTLDQTTFFGPFLQAAAGLPAQGGNLVDHDSKSTALFADVQWKITEQLRLSVGGRYTWDDKSIFNDYLKTGLPALTADESASWSKFTPRASLDYMFGDQSNTLVYGSFSRGYRAGGFNGRGQTSVSARTPYDPETVDSYELGFKTELWDNRITFNVAGFLSKYKDKQEEIVRPAAGAGQETLVLNAATATIKGLEAEFRAQPAKGLSLNGSLGLLDANYDEFDTLVNGVVTDVSNREMRRTPDLSFSLGADWTVPLGFAELGLAASYRHVAKFQTTIVGDPLDPTQNDPRGLAQARDLLDASAALDFLLGDSVRGRVAVFGRNLTDDRGLNSTLPVAGLFTFSAARPPRTFGVEFGIDF